MSLGFTVEDIHQASQLSYRLFNAESIQRTSEDLDASTDALKRELFATHCTLGHLRHIANDENGALLDGETTDQKRKTLRQSLDKLVAGCATTLREIEKSATIRNLSELSQGIVPIRPMDCGEHDLVQTKSSKFMDDFQLLPNKDETENFKRKLQSHNDAMNLVLNTFHWARENDGSIEERHMAQAMQKFQQKTTNSDAELKTLVEEILVRLKTTSNDQYRAGNRYGDTEISGGYVHQGDFSGNMTVNYYFANAKPEFVSNGHTPHTNFPIPQGKALRLNSTQCWAPLSGPATNSHTSPSNSIPHEQYHAAPQNLNPMAMSFISSPEAGTAADVSTNVSTKRARLHEILPTPIHVARLSSRTVPEIAELNHRRHVAGTQAVTNLKKKLEVFLMPVSLETKVPTIQELEQGLKYIFLPIVSHSRRHHDSEKQLRETRVMNWTQGFERLLQTHFYMISSQSAGGKLLDAERQTAYVGLLCCLNELIEDAKDEPRMIFYEASYSAGIENVFDKLLTLTKSVRAEREIDEFQIEREDFGRSNR